MEAYGGGVGGATVADFARGDDLVGQGLELLTVFDWIDPAGLMLAGLLGEVLVVVQLAQGWSGQQVEELLAQQGITIGVFKTRRGDLISFSVSSKQAARAQGIIERAGMPVWR